MSEPRNLRRGLRKNLDAIVLGAWALVVVVILIRTALWPLRHTVFTVYAEAGRHWMESRSLYPTHTGFIYSPLAAAFFAPFALLPPGLGNVVWRLVNLAVYLGAVGLWLRSGIARIPTPRRALVFLLMLPLSIGNINNGQANPMMIGLIMFALLAARAERWAVAALCVGAITFLKIYPLAVGLLLVVLFPRKMTWRLAVALLALGALSFLLQKPGYVLEQYRQWIATRAGDQRHYQPDIAPRDLWMLLRVFRIELDLRVYFFVQVLGGAALAALCAFGRLRGWSTDRLLTALLCLVCCWMLLLGPSPESATYVILAPAISLAVVEAFSRPFPKWMRTLPAAALAVLLGALVFNSYIGGRKDIYAMSVQPLGALLFCIYAVAWICREKAWRPDPAESLQTRM